MSEMDIDPIFPRGDKNDAYAANFIGQSYLNMLTTEGVVIGNVTFEPACRNNWHIHHASSGGGQILLCTAGSGWHQIEGQEPDDMVPGTVIQVRPGSSTGTAPRPIRGSPTSRSRSPPASTPTTNGWSRSPTRSTTS